MRVDLGLIEEHSHFGALGHRHAEHHKLFETPDDVVLQN